MPQGRRLAPPGARLFIPAGEWAGCLRYTEICTPRAMAEQLGRPYPDALTDLVLCAVDEVLGDLPTLAESTRQVDEMFEQRASKCGPEVAKRMRALWAKASRPMAPYIRSKSRRSSLLFGMLTRAREPERDRSNRRVAFVVALVHAWLDRSLAMSLGGDLMKLVQDECMFDLYGLTSDVLDGRVEPATAETVEEAFKRARLNLPRLASRGPPWEADLGNDERFLTLNGAALAYLKGLEHRRFSPGSREGRWLVSLLGGAPFGVATSEVRSHVKEALEKASDHGVSVVAEAGGEARLTIRVGVGPRLKPHLM